MKKLLKIILSQKFVIFTFFYLLMWFFLSPGIKHEEKFLVYSLALLMLVISSISIIFGKSRWLIPISASSGLLIGWVIFSLKFSIKYDEPLFEVITYNDVTLVMLGMVFYIFLLGLISNWIKGVRFG